MAGIFPRLALPARLGGAARIGDGKQWMSWIHIADLLRIIETVIDEPGWRGPVNAVAPGPERQGDFQRALARAYRRPFFLRIPGREHCAWPWVRWRSCWLRASAWRHRRLLRAGFEFRHFTLASALRDLIPDQHEPPRLRAADRDCEVWFNGDCPVCSYEIGAYAKARGAPRSATALSRFHARGAAARRVRTAPRTSGTQAVPA